MTDVVNRETRSRMMAGIRGKNTRPEMRVRRYLHATGLRFRLHDRALPGSPDLVFPAHRIAVFVHGCFWHRHPFCKYATMPAERREFWLEKFGKNIVRDQRNLLALGQAGWTPLVIWECETRSEERLDELYWQIRSESITNR
ncbi:very short patch repair endonuclease [Sphaerotilus montanus]|uniref:very short patch repair endonuclease n=1 Tax=Sphaerotilus montanus TaxID=522889 RepID=UPI003FA32E90